MILQDGSFKYIKIHIKSQLGVENLDRQTAVKLAGENPDYLVEDLFQAIQKGNFPVWNVFVQVMEPKQAESYKWNIFDMTKVWPHSDFPLRQIGRLTMNRNVSRRCFLNKGHGVNQFIIAAKLFYRYRTGRVFALDYGSWFCTFRGP